MSDSFKDRFDAFAAEARAEFEAARQEIGELLARAEDIRLKLAAKGIETRVEQPLHFNPNFTTIRMTARFEVRL